MIEGVVECDCWCDRCNKRSDRGRDGGFDTGSIDRM